jgi:hypothetical protein
VPVTPAEPPRPNVFERIKEDIFPHGEPPAVKAVSAELKALLRGHSATLIHAAAELIETGWPEAEPIASKVLEVALGVASAAGIAL